MNTDTIFAELDNVNQMLDIINQRILEFWDTTQNEWLDYSLV